MMQIYAHILNLYRRNTGFFMLFCILLVSAVLSKIFYLLPVPFLANDFSTLLFVATLWIAFYLGLMMKRQLANHRASLLPGYRVRHIHVFLSIYLFLIAAALVWHHGLRPLIKITPDGLHGVYISSLCVALVITYIGYVSIMRVFIYAYVLALIVAMNVTYVIALFEQVIYLKYIVGAITMVMLLVLIRRWMRLKESHYEYPYILAWPPKAYLLNQMKVYSDSGWKFQFFQQKNNAIHFTPYYSKTGFPRRVCHWEISHWMEVKNLLLGLIVVAPLYFIFMKSDALFADFIRNVYANFLLLAITPVVLTIVSQYHKFAYWGYDVIKPVSKNVYFKERGLLLGIHVARYWVVLVCCFALGPAYTFMPEVLWTWKFWSFIFLTGNFAFLMLAWLAWLSCTDSPKLVIINGMILSSLILFLFFYVKFFSLAMIGWTHAMCLASGIIFLKWAYLAWCQKEFV